MKLIQYKIKYITRFSAYCIEVIPQANKGNAIRILKNDLTVTTIPAKFTQPQKICFSDSDFKNDIIELRHTGNDGVTIKVNLIEAGKTKPLKFGKNQDLNVLRIDGEAKSSMGWLCGENVESTGSLKVKDGNIIQSECVNLGKFMTSMLVFYGSLFVRITIF